MHADHFTVRFADHSLSALQSMRWPYMDSLRFRTV